MSEWLTDVELAAWLKVSRVKLQQDRQRGRGAPYVKIGRAVRYRLADVEAWLKKNASDR